MDSVLNEKIEEAVDANMVQAKATIDLVKAMVSTAVDDKVDGLCYVTEEEMDEKLKNFEEGDLEEMVTAKINEILVPIPPPPIEGTLIIGQDAGDSNTRSSVCGCTPEPAPMENFHCEPTPMPDPEETVTLDKIDLCATEIPMANEIRARRAAQEIENLMDRVKQCDMGRGDTLDELDVILKLLKKG